MIIVHQDKRALLEQQGKPGLVTMSLAHHTESGVPLLHNDPQTAEQGLGQGVGVGVGVDESNLKLSGGRDRCVVRYNTILD